MKAIIISGIAIFLSLNGCQKDFIGLNEKIDLKYGETKTIYDPYLKISMDSVADGRCPIEVACIWGGNANVSFKFRDGIKETKFDLNTSSGFRTDTLINHYRIKLTGLTPPRRIYPPNKPEDYKAEIIITNE